MLITRKWDKWKLILLFFCPAVLCFVNRIFPKAFMAVVLLNQGIQERLLRIFILFQDKNITYLFDDIRNVRLGRRFALDVIK